MSVDAFYETALSTCGPGMQQHLTEYKHCMEEVKVGEKMDCLIRIHLCQSVAVSIYSNCAFRLRCGDPVEPLYYAANYEDICVYCCGDIQSDLVAKEYYPQCDDCKERRLSGKRNNIVQSVLALFIVTSCF